MKKGTDIGALRRVKSLIVPLRDGDPLAAAKRSTRVRTANR